MKLAFQPKSRFFLPPFRRPPLMLGNGGWPAAGRLPSNPPRTYLFIFEAITRDKLNSSECDCDGDGAWQGQQTYSFDAWRCRSLFEQTREAWLCRQADAFIRIFNQYSSWQQTPHRTVSSIFCICARFVVVLCHPEMKGHPVIDCYTYIARTRTTLTRTHTHGASTHSIRLPAHTLPLPTLTKRHIVCVCVLCVCGLNAFEIIHAMIIFVQRVWESKLLDSAFHCSCL